MAIQEVNEAQYLDALQNIANDATLSLEDKEKMQQNLIRTMQYIVDTELQKVQYDTSVEAVVINTDQADRGIYGVRIGETKCDAYSSNGQTYASNDVVYVTIPKGDYANDKFIIGRKAELSKDVGIYDYKFPFEDFIQLKEIVRNDGGTGGIGFRANQQRNELLQNDHVWELGAYTGDIEKPIVGTKLGITVDIQALLIDYNVMSGNYGLLIHVEGYEKDDSGENNTKFEKNFKLDINQMYGNPYVYPEFTTQQLVVDMSNAFSISTVQVSFWQDFDNEPFLNEYNQIIPWRVEDAGNIPCPYNLKFKNLAVYIGYSTGEIENNTVFLYTYHDLIYGQQADSTVERSTYDLKTMHMAFVHKDEKTQTFHLYDNDQELSDLGAHVYWYVKTEDWEVSADNTVYGDAANIQPYDRYLGNTLWAPIGNPPEPITIYNEKRWNESSLSFQADLTRDRYAFKVVVELNGEWYISDVLIFSNEQSPEADKQSMALNNKVILRVAMLLSAKDGTKQILYPDETLQHFFVYDENNRVLTSDDKRDIQYVYNGETVDLHALDNTKYSEIEYFVEIWMRDDNKKVKSAQRDLNDYIRLADWSEDGTNQYVPFKVTWTLPPTAESMMNVYHIPENYDGLYTWFAGRNAMNITWGGDNPDDIHTRYDIDRLTTVAFKIKDVYNFQLPNNIIAATIERNGQSYNVSREFYFGKAMAQGSPYTPMININLPEGNRYWVTNAPFEMQCKMIDLWGKEFTNYTCIWSFVGETKPTNLEYENSYVDINKTQICGHNAIIKGKAPATCVPLVVRVDVTFDRDNEDLEAHDSESESYSYKNMINEELHAVRGICMTDNPYFLTYHTVVCPEKIQFSADGQSPQYFTGDFICRYNGITCESEEEAQLGLKDEHPAFFYPNWHLDIQDTFLKNIVYLKTSPKYQSEIHTVLSNDEYNEDYNYVYLSYETMDYVVYDKEQDDANHTQWKQLVSEGKMAYRKAIPFEPTTKEESASEIISPPDVNQYRLLFQPSGVDALNITRNTWQWNDAYATDTIYLTSLWFEVSWKRKWIETNEMGEKSYHEQTYGKTTFRQTIAYDRSLYPSSLINKWDGTTLTLDKENGAILATMIAAGTKNTTTGAFTGVMMGNWAKKGDETFDSADKRENASGIYGFLEGAGTFGLLDDGTGYIGPAGKGRIQFDGQNALISNSDKSCYMNLNPNTLTQSGEGYYNTDNAGISPYFLYAKTPVDPNKFLGFDGSRDMNWANSFMQDDDNNYFVVDPSRGVLTTGGIVSKYGRIGNWYINSTGLYQKYVDDDPNTGNEHNQYLKAKTALEAAKLVLSYSTEENPWKLSEYLSDEEIAFVESNCNDKLIDTITEEDLNTALEHIKSELAGVDFTRDRFMYLGFPGIDRKEIFDKWKEYSEQIQDAEDERDEALGKKLSVDAGGDVASIIKNLYRYLDQTAFTMDVYHYFNTYIAVQANLDYLVNILTWNGILDENGKSLIGSAQQQRLKSKLISYKATFDSEGHLNRSEYEEYWYSYQNTLQERYAAGELTETEYNKQFDEYYQAMEVLSQYINITENLSATEEYIKSVLYDKYRLSHELLTYSLLNQYNHNHYSNGNASPAQFGLFNNVLNVLGIALNSSFYGGQSVVYAQGYNGTHLTLTEDGQYNFYSGIYQNAGEMYYTLNDIGAQRVASYDPRKFDDSTEWWESNITFPSSTTNRSISFWVVARSAGMPSDEYYPPSLYPTDKTGTILDSVWKNGTAAETSYVIDGSKLNPNKVDLIYVTEILIPALQAYCYYYDIYYNQALFYMLTQGLAKTAVTNPSDYEEAMAVINQVGGLEQIRKHGLATHHIVQAEFQFDGLSEEDIARIKKAYEDGINKRYDEIIANIKYERSRAIARLYAQGDTNKYAIYAGYNSPYDWADDESQVMLDPLFGVKWNGYMIARHGKIGATSPWYIGDGGLTQKNNSGIIFLGDPEEDGRPYSEDDLASFATGNATKFMLDEIDPVTGNQKPILCNAQGQPLQFLLPNSNKVKLPGTTLEYVIRKKGITLNEHGAAIMEDIEPYFIVNDDDGSIKYSVAIYDSEKDELKYKDENWTDLTIQGFMSSSPVPPKNGISAATLAQMIANSKLGPEAYETYGQFAIYAGDNNGIHFGVRMDGTIYGNRAQFDQIRISNSNVSGTSVESSNFFDITIQNSLLDQYGNPIVDPETGNPYHSYTLTAGPDGSQHVTYTDQNGNTSTYYGGTTTYTDEEGNQQRINTTGQIFVDAVGHKYELNGQGYSYSRPDGSFTYVDEDGMHFHAGYKRVTPNADQSGENRQNPHALKWYEKVQETDDQGNPLYYKVWDENENKYVDDLNRPKYKYVLSEDRTVDLGKEYYEYPENSAMEFTFPNADKFVSGDDAAIATAIIEEKMILMGGSISAWGTNNEGLMATYKVIDGNVVEAIGLDARLNEIRLAGGQIRINGTQGILFIGNKIATNGSSGASIYTAGRIALARVELIGQTVGATTAKTTMTETSSATTLTTYMPIQWGSESTGGASGDIAELTVGDTEVVIDNTQGTYIQALEYDTEKDNKWIRLINGTVAAVTNNNTFDIGLHADDNGNPTYDETTGIPSFTRDGLSVEFMPSLHAENSETLSMINTLKAGDDHFKDYEFGDVGFDDGSCIVRPFKNKSILGTPGYRWNIYADKILLVDEETAPSNGSREIYFSFAASKRYVDKEDAILFDNVIRVNNAAAAAFKKAVQALNTAYAAINKLKAFLRGDLNGDDPQATDWLGAEFDISTEVQRALQTLIGSGGNSTVDISGDLDGISGTVSINIGSVVSATGTVSGSLGAGSTLTALIEEMAEKAFKNGWESAVAAAQGAEVNITFEGCNNDASGSVTAKVQITIPGSEGGASGGDITGEASKSYTYTPSTYTEAVHSYTASSHSDDPHSYTASSHSYTPAQYTESSLSWS